MPRVITRWLGRGLLLGSAVVVASACETELPAGPDQLTQGITIYEHAGFAGKSAYLLGDEADLAGFTGPCEHYHSNAPGTGYYYTYDRNDCISSIRVRRQ